MTLGCSRPKPVRKQGVDSILFASSIFLRLSIASTELGLNQLKEVDLKVFNIVLKALKSIYLVDLVQIHAVLGHSVPALEDPLLALEVVDCLEHRLI